MRSSVPFAPGGTALQASLQTQQGRLRRDGLIAETPFQEQRPDQ